ncbi:MAG: translocase FtsK [Parachlamydiales bacterium]|nr:translocase FtsK [Parachlamydiales bacterium]
MTKKKTQKNTHPDAKGLFLIAFGFLGLLSLLSFSVHHLNGNWLGFVGYSAALVSEYAFGLGAYLIPCYFLWWGCRLLSAQKPQHTASEHLYFLILLGSICILLNVFAESLPDRAAGFEDKIITDTIVLQNPYPHTVVRYNMGGVPFYYLFCDLPFANLQRILSTVGTTLIFSILSFVSFLLLTRVRILANLRILGQAAGSLIQSGIEIPRPTKPLSREKGLPPVFSGLNKELPKPVVKTPPLEEKIETVPIIQASANKIVQILKKERTKSKAAPKEKTPDAAMPNPAPSYLPVKYDSSYQLPSPNLLSTPTQKVDQPQLKKDLWRQSAVLEETLKSFGIEAKVGEIHSGPTITSFEVHPSIGVKVQKIKALENDIALNMQAKSIRIVAPIPGKAAVGVEVPALHPQEVSFKEMLLHYQQKGRKLQIPILLGKGVSGDPVFGDLTKMPHLLIAGATGSGKSVCINTIVMSILMTLRPEEVRLLMVDPKKVELTQYSRLPHMIAPVITEPHGAYAALQWLVKEMQLRYEILKQLGLRNLTAFNNRKVNSELESSLSTPIPAHLPMIVAIVDEFADLMMVSSADIETPIARIAQMARAVGIHLILATQRPSREVITGIIKANITSRIAFKVASRINSQIILDDNGAENLLGNGDCLFLPPGSSQLIRAQGAFISDDDINQIIQHASLQASPNYLIPSFDAFRPLDSSADESDFRGKDALYDQALLIVVQSKVASTTFLQRKLKIGYARAASLMDELEENGIIGPQDGSKPRRILSSGNPLPAFDDESS